MNLSPITVADFERLTETITKELAEIKELTRLSSVRQKLLFDISEVAFLTSFSVDTVKNWIYKGRPSIDSNRRIFLKPAKGVVDRGVRIHADELEDFLSHFPSAKAV
ncbi:helix-turn-helix domain-containing protein [Tellurirhabdus bombi]|uniref:helix-turn-helix domain-containing protein n=1 Tax=Tellurirhabdus bombi TaxID=2907205 RepID=UPI001F190E44|nr:helix-turn-helix domain-containing protein [Tellurirhabdus bombi]